MDYKDILFGTGAILGRLWFGLMVYYMSSFSAKTYYEKKIPNTNKKIFFYIKVFLILVIVACIFMPSTDGVSIRTQIRYVDKTVIYLIVAMIISYFGVSNGFYKATQEEQDRNSKVEKFVEKLKDIFKI